jgi:hypothetical protein
MKKSLAVVALVSLAACGGGSSSPTTPSQPTPTPTPTPSPTPTPTPNAYAQACGEPLPPWEDAYGFSIGVLRDGDTIKILNASPLIRNPSYCAEIGLPGPYCKTRPEGHPQRAACDHYLSGISLSGRPGPNWFQVIDGQWFNCGGYAGVPDEGSTCGLKESDQYLLDVSGPAIYRACGGEGGTETCGGCVLDPWTFDPNRTDRGFCRGDAGD